MDKKRIEYVTISLLLGYLFTLFLGIIIYKNVTEIHIEYVVISYMPLIFASVYLIIWAPFSMKIFYKKMRNKLIIMAMLLLSTVMIYVNIKRFEMIIGFNMCVIILVVMASLTFIINIFLIREYKLIDDGDIEIYKQFILRDREDFFENVETRRVQRFIFYFRISSIVFLSVNNVILFCIVITFLLILEIYLSIQIIKHYTENKKILKSYFKIISFKYLIYILIFVFWYFHFNFTIQLLLLFNCFDIPFLKENIANQEFENYILLKGLTEFDNK